MGSQSCQEREALAEAGGRPRSLSQPAATRSWWERPGRRAGRWSMADAGKAADRQGQSQAGELRSPTPRLIISRDRAKRKGSSGSAAIGSQAGCLPADPRLPGRPTWGGARQDFPIGILHRGPGPRSRTHPGDPAAAALASRGRPAGRHRWPPPEWMDGLLAVHHPHVQNQTQSTPVPLSSLLLAIGCRWQNTSWMWSLHGQDPGRGCAAQSRRSQGRGGPAHG